MNPRGLIVGMVVVFALIATVMIADAQGPRPGGAKAPTAPVGTAFTYQGQLKKNGALVNSSCNVSFDLYDALNSGNHLAGPVNGSPNPASVTNGLFTVQVDFGASVLTGALQYLQPTVQCTGDGSPTPLSRQQLTPAPYSIFSMAPWVPQGNNIYYNNGNVGIGTTNPTSKLEIAGQDGLAITGYQPYLTFRDTNASNKRSVIQSAGGNIYFIPDSFIGGNAPVAIDTLGHVCIGLNPPCHSLDIAGVFYVFNDADMMPKFGVTPFGVEVYIDPQWHNSAQVCFDGSTFSYLRGCASAAEYVPTIDRGLGYPETADLVSIAPVLNNPYGDTHSPFTVQKSTTPCDPNLLGYITNPENGADGEKKNDHYLPLAIYGYFPAKVTTANGAIHRGDPLTSSAKVGYAMKATGACKIIGYALEDANADGTIQVFAHLSENTASQVAALQKENADLKAQNAQLETRVNTLEEQSVSLQARLSTLEQLAQANNAPTHSDSTGNVALIVVGGLIGIVVMQKSWRR